jgi:FixJ family two-component response regulator
MQDSHLYSINSDADLQHLTSSSGYCVEHFSSWQIFLEYFECNRSDVMDSRKGCVLLNFFKNSIELDALMQIKNSKFTHRFPVIVLAEDATVMDAVQFIKTGAWHFFEKTKQIDFEKFRFEVEGAINYSMTVYKKEMLLKHYKNKTSNLTEREHEVMLLIAKGLQNKIIADRLNISERTVEIHRARVYRKLDVKSAVYLSNLVANFVGDLSEIRKKTINEASVCLC